jgi:hypothetical protein
MLQAQSYAGHASVHDESVAGDLGDREDTEVRARLERARSRPLERPVILDQLQVGQRGTDRETVTMGMDTHMGELYPFTLADKLEHITETIPWYRGASPWGGPVVPTEMVSVLAMATSKQAGFQVRQPSVGRLPRPRVAAEGLVTAGRGRSRGTARRRSRGPRP